MSPKPDAVPAQKIEVRTSALEDEFEAWVRQTFDGVPGLTTEIYNRFRDAADQFKARLRAGEK